MCVDLVQFDNLQAIEKHSKFLNAGTYIIARSFKSEGELSELNSKIKKFNGKTITFKTCHIIEKPDMKQIQKFRGKTDFIAVRGGTPEMNKFALSHKGVNFLLQPCISGKLGFDTALARTAKENKVPVAVPFSQFLNSRGRERSMLFKNYLMAVKIMRRFKVPVMFFSCARNGNELRAPENFTSFAQILGFGKAEANAAVSANLKKISGKKKIEGFEVVKQ